MTNEQIEIGLRHLQVKVDKLSGEIDKLNERIEKFNDRFDNWLRWVIGLQLGSYLLIIGSYFLRK